MIVNDIALVKLAESVDFVAYPGVTPICLPYPGQNIDIGVTCWAVGWGMGEYNNALTVLKDKLSSTDLFLMSK